MSPKWMTSLVRARQLQEEAAKQSLATAQREVISAQEQIRYNCERIDSLVAADAQDSAPAFVAAAVALQAAAATHSYSVACAAQAAQQVLARRDDLGAAARARRTAEEIEQRVQATELHLAALAAQRDLDEVAARISRDLHTGARS